MVNNNKKDELPFLFGVGEIFKGLEKFVDLVQKMELQGNNEWNKSGQLEGFAGNKELKGTYGLSVRLGGLGENKLQSFGNLRPEEKGFKVEESWEPIVDLFDEGEKLIIVVEIPGVNENRIKLALKGDILLLDGEGLKRRYQKEIILPWAPREESLKFNYRHGILEIQLTK